VGPPHYVIVGSGIAALAAAEALRQRDQHAVITMISEEKHDFYSRPGLAYLLRGDIPEKQLRVRTRDDLRALKLNRVHARAVQLDCAKQELALADGRRLRYHRLLLATGALAVPPAFPGTNLVGVVKLDSLDDARHILKLARRARTAVVIGGGITALELAEGLNARGVRVHYFLRGDRYWSDVLDESESRVVLERLRHEGVTVHVQTQIMQALGARGQLTAVETQTGVNIPCQMLAVAIGVRPRTDLARQAGLTVEKGIVVNEYLESSVAGVFAAGDVAEVFDSTCGKGSLDVLWPTALAQGRIAGANMAGAGQRYAKSIPFNVTMLSGLKVTVIGAVGGGKNEDLVSITRGESEAWRQLPRAWVLSETDDVNRVRLLVGEQKIVGALVMGDQTWSSPLQRLILAGADISPIRAVLANNDGLSMMHLANFYQHWERAMLCR
jgi:NAD(P)H-nitrite reductase large subunit